MDSSQEMSWFEKQFNILYCCFSETSLYMTPGFVIINHYTSSKQMNSIFESIAYYTYCLIREETTSVEKNIITNIIGASVGSLGYAVVNTQKPYMNPITTSSLSYGASSSVAYTLSYNYLPSLLSIPMTFLIEIGTACIFSQKCSDGLLGAFAFSSVILANNFVDAIQDEEAGYCILEAQHLHTTVINLTGCTKLSFHATY